MSTDLDSKELYRLNEAEANEEVERLAEFDSLDARDLGLARYLAQRAVNDGASGLAAKLVELIPKTASALDASRMRRGELVSKSTMTAFAREIMGLVHARFSDLDEFESRIDALVDDLQDLITNTKEPSDAQ